jgi:protocatechuate 3,4-dioxygenase beta subunit
MCEVWGSSEEGPVHKMAALDTQDEAQKWIDEHCLGQCSCEIRDISPEAKRETIMYKEYLIYKPTIKSPRCLPPTPADILGPFYKAGAPDMVEEPSDHWGMVRYLGRSMIKSSTELHVSGQVVDVMGRQLPGVVLDIWQADANGEYDNVGFKFRGKLTTGPNGLYSFVTVVPGDYQINDSPPDFRCAHIHVILTAPGFKPLTTQLYFLNDRFNSSDHWFDPRRVIGTLPCTEGKFDFVLEPLSA